MAEALPQIGPYAPTSPYFSAYSNYLNSPNNPNYQPSTSGQVLGASSTKVAAPNKSGISAPNNSGISAPNNQNTTLNAPPPPPSVDPLFQPAIDALNSAFGSAQQGYNAQEAGITANQTSQRNQVGGALSEQQGLLAGQRNTQTTETENAIAQARQAAAELQQGLQSRYGGTTGTGSFAGALAGRTSQTQIGQYRTNLVNNLQAIDTAGLHAKQLADSALQDIDSRTQAAIQQAKSGLEDRLTQIRLSQGELQGQKAQLSYQAIQHYQDVVNGVNQFNTQFKQQLALEHQRAQDYISGFRGQLMNNYGGVTQFQNLGNSNVPTTGNTQPQSTNFGTQPLGQNNKSTFPYNSYYG